MSISLSRDNHLAYKNMANNPPSATSPISLRGFIVTILAITLAFFSAYSLFLLTFGLLPAMVAIFVDTDPSKYLTRIITCFNLAGIIPYVSKLLFHPNVANATAIQYILDPFTWLIIYASSATGWVVFWIFPAFNVLLNNLKIQFHVLELNNELNILTKEWGKEIQRHPQI